MTVLLFLVFSAAVLAAAAGAVTGGRGQVCERDLGYVVPAVVKTDPALNARANGLVTTWCTAAAVLAAVPLLGLAIHGLGAALPLWALVALAAHGFLVACVGAYPFERIQHLDTSEGRRGVAD